MQKLFRNQSLFFYVFAIFGLLSACQKVPSKPLFNSPQPDGRVSGGGGFYYMVVQMPLDAAISLKSLSENDLLSSKHYKREARLADRYHFELAAPSTFGTVESLSQILNFGTDSSREKAIEIALNEASGNDLGSRLRSYYTQNLSFEYTDKPSPNKKLVRGNFPGKTVLPAFSNLTSSFVNVLNISGMLAYQDFLTGKVEVYSEHKNLQNFDRIFFKFHEAYVASTDWDSDSIPSYVSLGETLAKSTETLVHNLQWCAESEMGPDEFAKEMTGMMEMATQGKTLAPGQSYRAYIDHK